MALPHARSECRTVDIPLKDWPSAADLAAQFAACTDRPIAERLRRKLRIREALGDGATSPLEIWGWRLGEALVLGTMGEAYSCIQQNVRAAIAAVVSGLVEIKHLLGGFTTMFPMVGVVASYESRHSLWTIVRRIAWLLILMPPMMGTIRLLQPQVGTPIAVLLSWPVMLTGLWIWYTRFRESSHPA